MSPLVGEALQVVREQAEALARLVSALDERQLTTALSLLLERTGKVVTVGSGKSGIAARKIAATLTSTGTVSVFLHPVDALHGDLGIVSSDDVAIVVSNSGETEEITAVLSHLKHRGVPVIAITGGPRSTLAKGAAAVLDARVPVESGGLGIAPTTSTTVAMVLGDALAMATMSARGFTLQDFVMNHPGGQLGRRLTVRVGDVMHQGEASPAIAPDSGWQEIVDSITRGGLGAASVVGADGRLLGLITDGDVRRMVRGGTVPAKTATELMTADPVTVEADTLAADALRLMEERPSQISVLPVVDADGRSIGLVRVHDIIRAGLR